MGIKDGNLTSADEVMNTIGSNFNDTAQMIFNADYIGFDSRLDNTGDPSLKNVFYDTFQTDSADVSTGFSHNSTDDTYDTDFVTSTPVLVMKETTLETVTNAVPIFNFFAPVYKDVITNPGFEDVITTEWTYSETSATFTGARTSADPRVGTYEYTLAYPSTSGSGTYAQIEQTVDFTNSTHINVWFKMKSGTGFRANLELYIDTTLVATKTGASGETDTSYDNLSAEIPTALRTTGKLLKVRYVLVDAGGAASGSILIDGVQTYDINDTDVVISVSADSGSNYVDVDNAEIARPTSGTGLWWKITLNRTDLTATDTINETAIKCNLY